MPPKASPTMTQQPFIQKLTLRNFRSIRNETVTFANPLFLVGRNGSGKSNFVDALAFLSECMTNSLQSVIEKRGGLGRIGYLDTSLASSYISFRVDFRSEGDTRIEGFYEFAFRVDANRINGLISELRYAVVRERCELTSNGNISVWFDRVDSQIKSSVPGIQFAASPLSLVIPLVSGVQDFALVHQFLAAMRVYKIDTNQISGVQKQDDAALLKGDGSNLISVLQRLAGQRDQMARVNELLQTIVPGVIPALSGFTDGKSRLFFEQQWPSTKSVFEAAAMSSGTLYALGLVVAALQDPIPSLIAIEEPEMNIHPGALDAIADILNIAAQRTQVVVTTHSPDLLDAKWIQPENLRVVEWENGATHITGLGEAPVKALQQHLMGAGELMRANALDGAAPSTPDSEDAADLFESNLA